MGTTGIDTGVDALLKDLRYALRGFRREPGFTLIAVLILALGIGANTAVFSVINPLLLRPLPFRDGQQLMWITNTNPKDTDDEGLSGRTYRVDVYEELKRHARSFQDMSAYFAFFGFESFTLTSQGDPERLAGVRVAPRFFEVLGVQPSLGRLFAADDIGPGAPQTGASAALGGDAGSASGGAAIISHALWQRRFASDPAIVGRALTINDRPVTVVGVLPADFDFSATFTPGVRVDFFVPAMLDQMRPWGNTLAVVARLKPGATAESARAELATLMPQLNEQHRDWRGQAAAKLTTLKDFVSGQMRRSLFVLWGAVGLVLLIVCANLSNLLLARSSSRGKEIAVRMALGASRARIVRQLLTEGVLLSLAGAAVGVPLAYALTTYLAGSATMSVPLLHQVKVDGAALLFTALVAMTCGVLFGTIPALRLSGRDPHNALKEQSRGSTEGRGHAWVRSALVIAEVTLASVLLVCAGLLLRSFVHLLDVDLGFKPSQTFAVRIDLSGNRTPEQRRAVLDEMTRRVAAMPGVEAAGMTDALPLDRNRTWGISAPGDGADRSRSAGAFVYVVGPGYLRAMGIPLKAGRDFGEQDTAKSLRVIIVNESLARRLYPNQQALGRVATVGGDSASTIVGVVADVRQSSVEEASALQMYLIQSQSSPVSTDLVIRSTLPAASLMSNVRSTLGALDPSLLSTDFRAIDTLVERAVSPRRFLLTLLGGFSILALVLACLGIYGVVSYGVSQRVQEIGIRMALGATAVDVSRQVIGGTLRLALIGIALGLAISLALARLIASLLYGTSPTDFTTFAATAAALTLVALVAGAIPALRAARIDPMSALRAD